MKKVKLAVLIFVFIFAVSSFDHAYAQFWKKWLDKKTAAESQEETEQTTEQTTEQATEEEILQETVQEGSAVDVAEKAAQDSLEAEEAYDEEKTGPPVKVEIKMKGEKTKDKPQLRKLPQVKPEAGTVQTKEEEIKQTQAQLDQTNKIQELNRTQRSLDSIRRINEMNRQNKNIQEINKINKMQKTIDDLNRINNTKK